MSSVRKRFRNGVLVAAGVFAVSTAAFGLPWDLDMTDAQFVKAYRKYVMQPLPDGVVSQQHALSPKAYVPSYVSSPPQFMDRTRPDVVALQNPLEANEANLAQGKQMYDTYCSPCHGDGTGPGPVGKKGMPAATIAGSAGRAAQLADGSIYWVIRNGSVIMPAYGYAMTNDEAWSIVSYIRSLPDSQHKAAAPTEGSAAPKETPQ